MVQLPKKVRHIPTLSLTALALVLVMGCQSATRGREVQDAEQVVREFVSIWNAYDPALVSEIFTRDAVYEDQAFDVHVEGPTEIRFFFEQSWKAVPDLKMEVISMFSSGAQVATQWILSGTHEGDYPGLPATHKSFSIRGVGITEVYDGKVKRHTDYYDEAEFRRQLGLLPGVGE